ncbi:MAG: peptidoglycan DD-metalloendopeptidase family protein [Oscillospiraceae bacterium]|nr:peptidoglycan DD-metalloendopeptidase family protein [Oscillospiraceae bacterium]
MSKRMIRMICILLAALMVGGLLAAALTTQAHAVTQAEIDRLQAQRSVIQSQKRDVQEQIQMLRSEKAGALERKEALDEENELNWQEIQLIDQQITLYDEMIEEKGVEVDEARDAEERQYERYLARVRTMEETNALTYLSVLLKANSLTDFLGRLNDIMDIVRTDQNVKAEYIAAREHLEAVKAEYEQVQEQQKEKREELQEQRDELTEKLEYAQLVINQLEDDLSNYEAAFNAKAAEEVAIQNQIDAKVEELRRQQEAEERARQAYLEAQRRAQAAANQGSSGGTSTGGGTGTGGRTTTGGGTTGGATTGGGSTGGGTSSGGSYGYFTWPVPASSYITSRFGYRIHPILGTSKYHAGVDIAASYGTAINAAAGGTVQVSTYNSSYGNYCVIYHSNGTTTLYAHMNSRPIVSVGQTVYAGQQIGYVGSTGLSNGPHCHFEVRVNGANVNPLSYFSGMAFTFSPSA